MKYLNTIPTRGLNLIKSWLRPGYILTSLFLLTIGVTNAWGAWSFSGTSYMYFQNKGSWGDSYKYLIIGKGTSGSSSWSECYSMSPVTGNTTLWVATMPSSGWTDATYMAIIGNGSSWGGGQWGTSNLTNANHRTGTYTSGISTSANQRYILIPANGNNGAAISLTYLGTSNPNYTITVKAKISTDGGSTYSEATSPATLSASSKNFTTYNSCNNTTSLSSGTISCGYLAATSLTAPSTDPTGYTFVGWYNSSGTQQTTSKTLSLKPTADATYYAYYKAKQYSGTINANGGAANQSYTATYRQTSLTIATAPSRTGYTLSGYYKEAGCSNLIANTSKALQASTAYTNSSKQWTYTSAPTLYAGWTATQYTITFDKQSGTGGTASAKVHYDNNDFTVSPVVMPTRTGYTLGGYYTATGGGGVQIVNASGVWQSNKTNYLDASGNWIKAANTIVYAQWTAKSCTVNFDFDETDPGYASKTGATTSTTATYDAAMTTVTPPTAKNGYAFMGYYDSPDGAGTQYYKADGTSQRTWNKNTTSTTTLYAYYKKAAITNIALSPGEIVAPGVTVTATATISPTPMAPTIVCWKLLRSNGSLYSDDCFTPASGNSVSFTAPASGSYKIATILRTGSSCGGGTVLDSVATNIVIATDHTVTIKYMCDGEVIKEQTTTTGKPLVWTSISAPTIFGYVFTEWEVGDAITLQSSATTTPNKFKATYDGYIIAKYRRKGIIYFMKPNDWTGTKVYYYNLGSSDKWHTTEGDWNKRGIYTKDISWGAHEMTRITGTSIYYYDYEAANNAAAVPGDYIAFVDASQDGYEPIYNCKASYPIQYTKGFNAGTPMFVCTNYANSDVWNSVKYYNHGYWTKYEGGSGYTLKIYNKKGSGRQELKSIPFVTDGTNNFEIPFKAIVDLDAATTYGFKIVRDNNIWFKNDNDGTMTNSSHDSWPFVYDGSDGSACGITTTGAGSYTFSLSYFNTSGANHELRVSVTYPAETNDFQILYYDNSGTASWSKSHAGTWRHPSRLIKAKAGAVDTISFFVAKGKSPTLFARKVNSINASTGEITWASININGVASQSLSVASSAVYNFKVTQGAKGVIASIENIGAYTGNYYIRCGALNSKWDNYKTDHDHLMTYTEFSEDPEQNKFGSLYSHYKAKWCPRGKRVNFCIANDYSPCITDTLWQDENNVFNNIYPENHANRPGELKASSYDGSGNITSDETTDKYSANIRFMWNRSTNKIGRAYVASATTPARQFLVLKSCTMIKNSDGSALTGTGESSTTDDYRAIFKDNQDFIYERMIKIQPSTRAKLYACYAYDPYDVSKAQFFRGAYDSGNCESSDANSIQIIGGSGDKFYTVRVIYDFKTNRLICAWLPDGTIIDKDVDVDADVMVIRDHQEPAECITFSGSGKLSDVKTVYGVLRLNRWTLNNRARGLDGEDDQNPEHCNTPAMIKEYHDVLGVADQKSLYERALYFISFPFDVKLSEVFGFGTYGIDWIVSEYNGLRRAQYGYFFDNCFNDDCTNWDYIWDRTGKTLEAYKGYLLSLEIDNMAYDNTDFWPNNISQKELYFPSASAMSTITTTNVTMPGLGDEYECKINYNKPEGSNPEGDRRMKDSYWRCIGTPSYATYGTILKKDGPSGSTIEWQSDRSWRATVKNFPFLYEWNVDDNSISVQATTRYNFKPTHAYLVQNGNAIYWTAVSATPSSIVRRQREEDNQEYYWRLTLEQDGVFQDQTYIRMTDNEQVTDTFDFGQDLVKESKVGYSNVYSVLGYERLAANSMPLHTENTTIIPLGVKALTAGEFTFDLPDGANGVGITLVDNETGEHTNLSTGMSYTIALGQGTYENRFYLEIAKIQNVATGTEEIGEPSKSDVRKVIINGILYIVRGNRIYDARGTRVE